MKFTLVVFIFPCLVSSFNVCSNQKTYSRQRSVTALHSSASNEIDWVAQLTAEAREIASCASIVGSALFKSNTEVSAEDIEACKHVILGPNKSGSASKKRKK